MSLVKTYNVASSYDKEHSEVLHTNCHLVLIEQDTVANSRNTDTKDRERVSMTDLIGNPRSEDAEDGGNNWQQR